MFRVTRPGQEVLMVSENRLHTLARLGVWVGTVVIFYTVVLSDLLPIVGMEQGAEQRGTHAFLLLVFPLFLLPYLFHCIRALTGAGVLVIDGKLRTVSSKRWPATAFADIRELRLQTVNATCEEYCLSAALADGRLVALLENKSSKDLDALAEEIANMVGVRLSRTV